MLDHFLGILLLGLGVSTGPFNPNVKGDTTDVVDVAQEEQVMPLPPEEAGNAGTLTGDGQNGSRPVKNLYKLNTLRFQKEGLRGREVTNSGIVDRKLFDAHAFGRGIMQMQLNFKERMEATRAAAKQEFEDRKVELKQKLAIIRDTKKKTVVERLNTNCQNVNENRTTKMTQMLEKLSGILTNVSNRAASASAAGKDITSVTTAVTAAQSSIADAQSLVTAQAGWTCNITITSEANLKTDVGKTVSGLQSNLRAIYEKVIAARKAVSDAVKALALVTGESL